MTRLTAIMGMRLLMLGGCESKVPPTCPDPAAITPPSIDSEYVTNLTARLAGPDRENSITEAIAEIHTRDPSRARRRSPIS